MEKQCKTIYIFLLSSYRISDLSEFVSMKKGHLKGPGPLSGKHSTTLFYMMPKKFSELENVFNKINNV